MSFDFENLATGNLSFKGIDFTFVFDRTELRLIPPKDKADEVEMWFMRSLGNGAYTFGDPVYIDDPFLIGKCNEGTTIILFPVQGHSVGRINSVLLIEIHAYIWKRINCQTTNQLCFQSPELDCIYPAKKALAGSSYAESGGLVIETKPYKDRVSKKHEVLIDEKKVNVFFDISLSTGGDFSNPPISLHSEMVFEFDETDDYAFVFRIYSVAKSFIQYLCYRKNTPFTTISLSAPYKDGKHLPFARLFILNESDETETKCLKNRRYIRYEYIETCISEILSDISNGLLYVRNIPTTYQQGRTIDAARFVMITAAFEWEFRRLYPSGINKRKRTIDAENTAEEAIKELLSKASGKLKDIYQSLMNNIRFTQFSARIVHTGKELGPVIDPFGVRIYRLNDEELKYSDMGFRLGKQRNNYAHGNIDQEFVGLSLLDLVYLEMVVYAMQLKFYKVEDIKIKRAINDLFHQSIHFKDEQETP